MIRARSDFASVSILFLYASFCFNRRSVPLAVKFDQIRFIARISKLPIMPIMSDLKSERVKYSLS